MKKTTIALAAAASGAVGKSKTLFIPLSVLFLSAGNVRRRPPTGIERLAAMILSQGLLHALHITAELDADGKKTGRYAVEAGGRRLRALQWLAENGKIFPDLPVECRLIDAAQASKISLIENISQEAMHPADEFAAFQTLATEGHTLESIAAEFGVTVVHIQRRLKMANVAPELVDLYRNNKMTLDQVMALASVDDHERQLLVWNGLSDYNRNAQVIKNRLTEDEVAASDVRVAVAGLDNYLAAGGEVRCDLFSSEEGTQYLTDCGLLEMLVSERLEQEAEIVRAEGWAWVEILSSYGYQEKQKYSQPPMKYLPETPEIEAKRLAFEAEMAAIEIEDEAAQDAEDWDLSEQLDEKSDAIEEKILALKELDSSGIDKSMAGAVITLGLENLAIHRGLILQADRKQAGAGNSQGAGSATASTRAEVPEKLMMDLSSHRTAAIQASMLANPQVTLAALAHKMAMSTFLEYRDGSPLKISLTQNRSLLEKNSLSLSKSRAAMALDAEHEAWKERLPEDSKDWFTWLLEQPQDVILSLIVFATAHCADALQHRLDSNDDAGPIARALSLDMADWWEASPAAYLELVPKSKLIETVTETAGSQVANEMLKMKKPEAVAFAASHIEGKRWLPVALRATVAVNAQIH